MIISVKMWFIVLAKIRDRNLFGFISLCKLHGDCNLVDLFSQIFYPKVILTKRPVIFGGVRGEQVRDLVICIET